MQGTMGEIIWFVMVIASAASLLVVNPRRARRKILRALRQYDDGGTAPAIDRGEGTARTDQPVQSE